MKLIIPLIVVGLSLSCKVGQPKSDAKDVLGDGEPPSTSVVFVAAGSVDPKMQRLLQRAGYDGPTCFGSVLTASGDYKPILMLSDCPHERTTIPLDDPRLILFDGAIYHPIVSRGEITTKLYDLRYKATSVGYVIDESGKDILTQLCFGSTVSGHNAPDHSQVCDLKIRRSKLRIILK